MSCSSRKPLINAQKSCVIHNIKEEPKHDSGRNSCEEKNELPVVLLRAETPCKCRKIKPKIERQESSQNRNSETQKQIRQFVTLVRSTQRFVVKMPSENAVRPFEEEEEREQSSL